MFGHKQEYFDNEIALQRQIFVIRGQLTCGRLSAESEKKVYVLQKISVRLHYSDHAEYRFLLIWILFHTKDTDKHFL